MGEIELAFPDEGLIPLNSSRSGGAVATLAVTAPITSSGGLNPTIGIVPATASVPGSMSAADKTKLNALVVTSQAWTHAAAGTTTLVGAPVQNVDVDTTGAQATVLLPGDATTPASADGDTVTIVDYLGNSAVNPIKIGATGTTIAANPSAPGSYVTSGNFGSIASQGGNATFRYKLSQKRWIQVV